MNEDLKIIKEKYGEKMMHLCRDLFSTLLETDGLLSKLMLDNFAPSRFLYDDIINVSNVESFKNYIYSLVDVEKKEVDVLKTPYELLDQAGYILYECKCEEDIQRFKKYYAAGEELCTFRGGRLNNCHVFFALKKNVDEIKRENFVKPERQDEYGTSVISIQFTRGNINTLSIKNRYNHKVNNPDATFSNNLDNIVLGLTKSFEHFYNLNINQNKNHGYEIPGYVKANDGKYYKYNYEINNIYYCPDNIIIDNFEVKKYDKEKYMVLDYFILDLVNKKVELYDGRIHDSFLDGIKGIDKINIVKDKEKGNKTIEIITHSQKQIIIEIDKFNRIIGYTNNHIKEVGNDFLFYNKVLKNFCAQNLIHVKNNFLRSNANLINLDLPNLKEVGNNFLRENTWLSNLSLPMLEKVGNNFLVSNVRLLNLDLPNLLSVGYKFLYSNEILETFEAPNLMHVRFDFLYSNNKLKTLKLDNLIKCEQNFLFYNNTLLSLSCENLEEVGNNFLYENRCLSDLNLPKTVIIGNNFLHLNKELEKINLPKLKKVGNSFLERNRKVYNIFVPHLRIVGLNFLSFNENIKTLNVPELEDIGESFLIHVCGARIYAPSLNSIHKIWFNSDKIKYVDSEEELEVSSKTM